MITNINLSWGTQPLQLLQEIYNWMQESMSQS